MNTLSPIGGLVVPRVLCRTSLAILLLLPIVSQAQEPPKTSGEEFEPLYNGKDLAGWSVKDGKIDAWKADGELLSCVGEEGGWLKTNKTYSDFVLKLEYRIPP